MASHSDYNASCISTSSGRITSVIVDHGSTCITHPNILLEVNFLCAMRRGATSQSRKNEKNLGGATSCQELNMEISRFLGIWSLFSACVRCEERLRPWPRPQTRASRNHTFSLFRSACLWFGAPQRMRSFDGAASLHAVPGQQLRGPSPRRDVTQRLTTLKASRL